MNTCPVCGYTDLPRSFGDDLICPCCGTHAGLDDDIHTHAELRELWIGRECQWWSTGTLPPIRWNAREQLKSLES